jgi:hypothetical protein
MSLITITSFLRTWGLGDSWVPFAKRDQYMDHPFVIGDVVRLRGTNLKSTIAFVDGELITVVWPNNMEQLEEEELPAACFDIQERRHKLQLHTTKPRRRKG